MFRANDVNGNSVYIDDVDKSKKYFCPACGEPLILKIFGTRKKHCFSHFPKTTCKDNWKYEPMSDWHLKWQENFAKENREVWIKGVTECHRADVFVKNVVIEFQHSHISNTEFNKRNRFYTSCGKSVVWVFDMRGQISVNEDGTFNWKKGNIFESTFTDFIRYNNDVFVFFEIDKEINNNINSVLISIINFETRRYFRFEDPNVDIIPWCFLKEYDVDMSYIEELFKIKIPSISELINRDIYSTNKQKTVQFTTNMSSKRYSGRGPREWSLPMNTSKHRQYNYRKRK